MAPSAAAQVSSQRQQQTAAGLPPGLIDAEAPQDADEVVPSTSGGRSRSGSAASTDSLLGRTKEGRATEPTGPATIVLARPTIAGAPDKPAAPSRLLKVRAAFDAAVDAGDAVAAERALARLPARQQFTLCNLPRGAQLLLPGEAPKRSGAPLVEDDAYDGAVDLEPRLPLCIAAAYGALPLVKVLTKPGRALTMAGDAYQGTAYTPMRWAADNARLPVMRTLFFDCGAPIEEALAVAMEAAGKEVCTFLYEAKVGGERLVPAMRAAVQRDDADSIDNLAGICGAGVNQAYAADNTAYSLLAWATQQDKKGSVKTLLQRKAETEYLPERYADETHLQRVKRRPLYLALERQPADPILVNALLDAGAKGEFDHLRLALANTGDKSRLYVALLRNKIEPVSIGEAATLRDTIKAGPDLLLGLVATQEAMVRRRQAWAPTSTGVLFADKGLKYLKAAADELAAQLTDGQVAAQPTLSSDVGFFSDGGGEWRPRWVHRLLDLGAAAASLAPGVPAAPATAGKVRKQIVAG